MAREILAREEAITAYDRGSDRFSDRTSIEGVDPAVADLTQRRRQVRVAKQHARLHRRVKRVGNRLLAQPARRCHQRSRELGRDEIAVLGKRRRRFENSPEAKGAETLEQPAPCLDRARHGHCQHAARRHGGMAARADRLDGGELARAPRADETDRRCRVGGPHDRRQVAGHRGHVWVNDAEHGVRRDLCVDCVAALAHDLGSDFCREVMRCGDHTAGQERALRAPGGVTEGL